MRWLAVLFLLLLAACSMGASGSLEPVYGNGVERTAGRDEAVVRAAGVSATISARWAAERSQSADITYLNVSRTPVAIVLPRLVMRHRLGDALLWSVSDTTGVDYEDARTDNDSPPTIYELKEGGDVSEPLVLKSGERRTLFVGFTNYPGEERIKEGDRVTMTVPLGRRDAVVKFEAG